MLSVGHKLGLFDQMAEMSPSTCQQLAEKTGYAERYLREWLAVMVVGRIIDYEATNKTYALPPEHAANLSRHFNCENLAVYAQCVPLMAGIYPKVLDLFRTGEGLSYQDFPSFHEYMAEDSGQTVVAKLFDTILPLAAELPQHLESGIRVLDAVAAEASRCLAWRPNIPTVNLLDTTSAPTPSRKRKSRCRTTG